MASAVTYFKAIITVQILYTFIFTVLAHALVPFGIPTFAQQLQPYQNQTINQQDLASKIQSSTTNQLNIPLVDLGSLVFYSGNILLDLMINFVTAIPGLFNLILDGLFIMVPIGAFYELTIKTTVYVFLTITYLITLIIFIMSVRSRGATIQ